jgi:hypothetical protein
MLELGLMPQLLQDKPSGGFKHDGAQPHICSEVTTFLNRQLPEQWIISWPLRSPYLIPLAFSVVPCERWGVHSASACNLNNLKDWIWTVIADIYQPLLQNVWHKVKYHLDMCRATNGAHFELAQGIKNTELLFAVTYISFLYGCYFLINKFM